MGIKNNKAGRILDKMSWLIPIVLLAHITECSIVLLKCLVVWMVMMLVGACVVLIATALAALRIIPYEIYRMVYEAVNVLFLGELNEINSSN